MKQKVSKKWLRNLHIPEVLGVGGVVRRAVDGVAIRDVERVEGVGGNVGPVGMVSFMLPKIL